MEETWRQAIKITAGGWAVGGPRAVLDARAAARAASRENAHAPSEQSVRGSGRTAGEFGGHVGEKAQIVNEGAFATG